MKKKKPNRPAVTKKSAAKKGLAAKAPAKKVPAKQAAIKKAPAKPVQAARPAKRNIFTMSMAELERRLAAGEVDAEMELYFGPQLPELLELARVSRSPAGTKRKEKPKVLILPGIMGSTLGFRRPVLAMFHDTVWIDPTDVLMGRLQLLGIPSAKKIIALDVFPIIYLGMKLELAAAGFDVEYFPFDWRLGLKELGAALKAKLAGMGSGKVHLAAHSMGGLVARAALQQGATNIGTVAMLGTPNHGSYSPVMALRGSHDLASKISGLDFSNDSVELTEKVFGTFPGLAQMLPLGPIAHGIDWHDAAIWPPSPRVRGAVLQSAATVTSLLAKAKKDWHLIAGINQDTIVRAERDPGGSGLRYQKSFEGDGTVPLLSAQLPELAGRVYYVEHGHGTLPMNKQVQKAVIQLFNGQAVTVLPATKPALRPAPGGWVTDAELAHRSRAAVRTRAASPGTDAGPASVGAGAERLRQALDAPLGDSSALQSPPAGPASQPPAPVAVSPPPAAEATRLRGYTVSRETQHFLEIELVHGDISQVNAEAIVLCRFQNMDLGRAAQAVDARMGGVLADMMRRRMFSSNVGEMFMLPTGRHPLSAEFVAVTGLGSMDALIKSDGQLSWDTLELVAENTLRTLLGAGVTEFATLLFGNLAKADDAILQEGLCRFLRGFVRALQDSKDSRRFRRVLLCEADEGRYRSLKKAILNLLTDPYFDTVQVRLDESVLPPPEFFDRRSMTAAAAGEFGRDPSYLFVRTQDDGETLNFEMTFASAGNRAAIPRESKMVSKVALVDALKELVPTDPNGRVSQQMVTKTGRLLADLLFHPTLQQTLEREGDNPLIIVHDAEASRIPWETLTLGDGEDGGQGATGIQPARKPGISRQYAAANLSVAKWMESRRGDKDLRVLLIADPTGDLPGAKDEGKRISGLLRGAKGVVLTEVWGAQATRSTLLMHFRSGDYDVIHYAGHAFFDPVAPMNSGLICAPIAGGNPSVLSGADLARLGQLPMLVFLNACETARVRGASAASDSLNTRRNALRGYVGVAEALMRGGVANFIGTYWPVGDDAALAFSESLYGSLLKGHPLGRAVTDARNEVKAQGGSGDWADYLHYGSPNFVLKTSDTTGR